MTHLRSCALITLVFLLVATAVFAEGEDREAPCSSPEYRQFDFWIGEWTVKEPDGEVAGHNTIERVLGGCALRETWRGSSGSSGYSFNMYDRGRNVWHQTWVDANGLLLRLEGGLRNGAMVLEGDWVEKDGTTTANRITWTPADDGTVRQHWEQSKGGGETWDTVFDGTYEPVGGGG